MTTNQPQHSKGADMAGQYVVREWPDGPVPRYYRAHGASEESSNEYRWGVVLCASGSMYEEIAHGMRHEVAVMICDTLNEKMRN